MPSLRRKSSGRALIVDAAQEEPREEAVKCVPCWKRLCCFRGEGRPQRAWGASDDEVKVIVPAASTGKESFDLELPRLGPCVFDVGSYYFRFGDASETAPTRWRSMAGRPKPTLSAQVRNALTLRDDIVVGDDLTEKIRALLDTRPAVSTTDDVDWDAFAALTVAAAPGCKAGLFAAPLGVGRPTDKAFAAFAENLLESAMEGPAQLGAVAVASATPLPLFAVGRTRGIALQIGHADTVVANVANGAVVCGDFDEDGLGDSLSYKIFAGCGGQKYDTSHHNLGECGWTTQQQNPLVVASARRTCYELPDGTALLSGQQRETQDRSPLRKKNRRSRTGAVVFFPDDDDDEKSGRKDGTKDEDNKEEDVVTKSEPPLDVVELLFGEPSPFAVLPPKKGRALSYPSSARAARPRLGPVQLVADLARTLGARSIRNVGDVPEAAVEILVSGGASLIPGFNDQLERKVRAAAEAKAMTNLSPRAGRLRDDLAFLHADDDAANWRGAAILASEHEFSNWILKEDYDELGPRRAATSFTL